MTVKELKAALVDECRANATRVDDFLAALGDIFVETLEKGDTVNLPTLGVFRLDVRKSGVRTIKWFTTIDTRAKLGLLSKGKKLGPMCATCGENKRYPRHRECRKCLNKRQNAKKEERR
jgi:nucleoid DNA-binding protein